METVTWLAVGASYDKDDALVLLVVASETVKSSPADSPCGTVAAIEVSDNHLVSSAAVPPILAFIVKSEIPMSMPRKKANPRPKRLPVTEMIVEPVVGAF